MIKFKHLCCLGLFCLGLFLSPSALRGQDVGSKAGQLWKDAQAAFGTGDYARASKDLEDIIKGSSTAAKWLNEVTVPPAPPKEHFLEPVFFMLGACYFNAKNWPQAISTFTKFRELFPKSDRLTQVNFSLAQANLLAGHMEEAIRLFTPLLPLPDYHNKTLMFLVEANKRAGNVPEAISLLEKERATPGVNPDFLQKVNMRVALLYLDNKNKAKVVALLQEMDANIEHVEDVTQFNALAIRLGDLFLGDGKIDEALNCYRRVRDNDQIVALQKAQIDNLKQQHAANMARIQANPLNSAPVQTDNKDIDAQIAKDQVILAQYQTLPPVLPPLFLRIAHAYSEVGEMWESAVVYREITRRYPQCGEAESALYGSIVIFDKLKLTDRAQLLCQSYLTQYPQGKYADSVGFLRGALAYDAEDFDKAIAYFEDSLKNQPNNPRRQQTELIIGDIKLREQKFDEAIAAYKRYQTDYPNGGQLEAAEYRTGLALLFGGKTEKAKAAIKTYLQKYPHGAYVADGEYRLDVIKFGDKQYDQVIADGLAWQKKHAKLGPLAEVLSLMGDCYASLDNKDDDAVKAYIRSYKAAQSNEVLNYSIFAAAKLLQKQGKWTEIADMFREFVKNNPDHPTMVSAIFWIGRADIKLGKVEEGKQFMAATAKQYLNDPTREAVDEIIAQLAQLYARKRPPVATPPDAAPSSPAPASAAATSHAPATASPVTAVTASAAPAPVAADPPVAASSPTTDAPPAASPAPPAAALPNAPPPPPSDPVKDLEGILTIPNLDSKPTARARILFAKAELAQAQRKPDLEVKILLNIANGFEPEDLSPILLGEVGDCLLQNNQPDQAQRFYGYLMDQYDKSPLVDYAYNGVAQIAYAAKNYRQADKYFGTALDKGLAATKLKEITLGEAQTLLQLNRPTEAKPLFEQVASTRAWRGEATALSVYSLGEVEWQQGKFPEANTYYQRVFVAYQKYPAIQAKAYLKSGEAFEKTGKIPEAIRTYSEMLKKTNLSSFPEITEARQRLEQLSQK